MGILSNSSGYLGPGRVEVHSGDGKKDCYKTFFKITSYVRGDSGFPVGGSVDPFGGLFTENVWKMKEMGLTGGGCAPENFACRSANVCVS